jgi:RNA polymerase sigma factor (sigma-70 family)
MSNHGWSIDMICKSTTGDSLLRQPVQIPTHEEDLKLIESAQQGDLEARNELIIRHLPIIIKVANKYYASHNRPSHVESEDMVQEAIFGVMRAIEKYDTKKSAGRFISYAKHWIRHFVGVAIHNCQMYKIPRSTLFQYQKGQVKTSEVRNAIKYFQNMSLIAEDIRTFDKGLWPEEEAILNEEINVSEESDKKLPSSERNSLLIFYSKENQVLKGQIEKLKQQLARITTKCKTCRYRKERITHD